MFHVDDLLSSHIDSKAYYLFLKWLNKMYGNHGEVQATCGKVHGYLRMKNDFFDAGKVNIDMIYYIGNMSDECTKRITNTTPKPAAEDLFAD